MAGVSSYGVVTARESADVIELRVEELQRVGYTLLPSGLEPARVEEFGTLLDAVYARQAAERDSASLDDSADANVARCLLAYDERFLELATNPALLGLCERVFGESFVLLQQNGVINRPARGHYQQRWHRDLPFQHWVASAPMAIAALFCVDAFEVSTGGTHALPGSHRHEEFPSDAFVSRHERPIEAPPGTFIVMDSMMFHRAGDNASEAARRAVNHLVGRPFLAQQIDLPSALGGAHANDPFLSRYLGYRWAPAASVEAWRRARLDG
ncbi:MAG: phytanoyl-CoA dioxygenase family protein [Actinomycetota bacterium]|nr:phytanoyl-CoA dioxygenase family protein [Actinomycetota bacterium]